MDIARCKACVRLSQGTAAVPSGSASTKSPSLTEIGMFLKRCDPRLVCEYLDDDVNLRAAIGLHLEIVQQPVRVDFAAVASILRHALRDGMHSGYGRDFILQQAVALEAIAQQPVAPLLDAVKVPQPRPDYPNGVLTIKAARDAFPRSHPMFAALDQAASDLAMLDARDRRRKQPVAPSGEACPCESWEENGGWCKCVDCGRGWSATAAPQQPAGVDERVVERIAALLHEEATGEPWTVAGVEHPGPDRDYYRGLARKVADLAAQHQEQKP